MAERRYRIGEFSQLTQTNAELLRAWERRYGLLTPERSAGGQRTYTEGDLVAVQRMQRHLEEGVPAAEAARLARSERAVRSDAPAPPATLAARLREALESMADSEAQKIVDSAFAAYGADTVLTALVLPLFRELGDRWASGEVTVAQEHFASNLLRARLLALARGWDAGLGPRALLACPPGELHDIGLICFGLLLRERGWRISYLGQDTPAAAITSAAAASEPDVIVLATVDPARIEASAADLKRLAKARPVLLGGAGAQLRAARAIGARALPEDPVEAVTSLAETA